MYLGSRVKSLSFCFLPDNHVINITNKKSKLNNATAIEKSRLIMLCRKVDFYRATAIGSEACLLYEEIAANIAHAQKINL
jgi:hypothetical protein